MNKNLKRALIYASRGWHVFPLPFKSKAPFNSKLTFKNASTDPEQIKKWFKNKSNINIGIATGRDSNLFVLDIDVHNGTNGFEALKGLEARFDELPPTLCCQTGSGGKHFYFEYAEGGVCTASQLGSGIDTRGDGGYVVAPGSVHANGNEYVFEDYDLEDLKNANLNKCPDWLPPLLKNEPFFKEEKVIDLDQHRTSRAKKKRAIWDGISVIKEGSRNESIFQLTCSLIGKGGEIEEIRKKIMKANFEFCKPPLKGKEINNLIDSAFKRYVDPDHFEKAYVPPIDKELTEVRHAERFIKENGENVGFISNQKKWIVWNGKYWEIDEKGKIFQLLEKVTDKVWRKVAEMPDDPFGIKQKWTRYATKLHSFNGINAVLKIVSNQILMTFADFDQDAFYFNCESGVIDLKTGKLKNHDPNFYISQHSKNEYAPDMNCDNWLRFLDKVTGHNDELISYIQRAIGYALTGSTSEQCLFILHGQGQNGKSTFLNVVQELVGNYGQTKLNPSRCQLVTNFVQTCAM